MKKLAREGCADGTHEINKLTGRTEAVAPDIQTIASDLWEKQGIRIGAAGTGPLNGHIEALTHRPEADTPCKRCHKVISAGEFHMTYDIYLVTEDFTSEFKDESGRVYHVEPHAKPAQAAYEKWMKAEGLPIPKEPFFVTSDGTPMPLKGAK